MWLTVKEASVISEVKPGTLRKWCRNNYLTNEGVSIRKLGKLYEIDKTSFLDWIDEHYKRINEYEKHGAADTEREYRTGMLCNFGVVREWLGAGTGSPPQGRAGRA